MAILLVLLEHLHGNLIVHTTAAFDTFHQHFNGGAGVDLFFAISGFVIARGLLPHLLACPTAATAWQATLAFWLRRAWRLLPSAWLWLLLILLATHLFNHSGAFGSLAATAAGSLAAVFQLYNLHFARCFMAYDCGANFVFWSLSLEEQFYLTLPLLILIFRRKPALLTATLLALILWQLVTPRSLLLVMLRSDALLLGVLLASLTQPARPSLHRPSHSWPTVTRRSLALLLIPLLGITAASPAWPSLTFLAPWRFSLLALLATLLVWLAAADRDDLLPAGPLRQGMLWIGSRSYALYLCHIPAFYASRELWFRLLPPDSPPTPDSALLLTAGALTPLLAELNYRLIERKN